VPTTLEQTVAQQLQQQAEGGNAFAKYAVGPVVVGYGRSLIAPNIYKLQVQQ
jgi:hypothetical protein